MNWISVKDKLPEESNFYFIISESFGIALGFYYKDKNDMPYKWKSMERMIKRFIKKDFKILCLINV